MLLWGDNLIFEKCVCNTMKIQILYIWHNRLQCANVVDLLNWKTPVSTVSEHSGSEEVAYNNWEIRKILFCKM